MPHIEGFQANIRREIMCSADLRDEPFKFVENPFDGAGIWDLFFPLLPHRELVHILSCLLACCSRQFLGAELELPKS